MGWSAQRRAEFSEAAKARWAVRKAGKKAEEAVPVAKPVVAEGQAVVQDLSHLTDQQLVEALMRAQDLPRWEADPLAFGRECLSAHFRLEPACFHRELVEVGLLGKGNRAKTGRKVAVAAPRQFAKSTIFNLLLPLWALCFNKRHFIIMVSNTHDQAKKFLQALQVELETNEKLRLYFPDLKINQKKWSDDDCELMRGKERYKILAKGAEAQLRGFRFLQHRPDLIIIDDGENDEMVRSKERRGNYQHWLDHVVLQTNPEAWVIMIGTILHEAALLNRIIAPRERVDQTRYADWATQLHQALLDEGTENEHSAWPQFQTTEALKLERERDPYGFSQEKQNRPVPADYCPFKPEYFTDCWWDELPEYLKLSITMDPACTDKEYSDETAICVAGWDKYGELWVLDIWHGKYTNPSDIIEQLMLLYKRWSRECKQRGWDFHCIGIEGVAFQKFLVHLFRDACEREKLHPYVKELKADTDKTRRIWQLEPLFRQKRIKLPHSATSLEHQLRLFPNAEHDDQADSTAYHLFFMKDFEYHPKVTQEKQGYTFAEYAKLSENPRRPKNRFYALADKYGANGMWN